MRGVSFSLHCRSGIREAEEKADPIHPRNPTLLCGGETMPGVRWDTTTQLRSNPIFECDAAFYLPRAKKKTLT